jgi:hypothetical protein
MPTPKGKAALAKRQKERADLKSQDIIWIGIAASEMNIQRLGTLLMLADWPMVLEKRHEDQLECVIPGGEGFEATPMDLNYELIRRDIVNAMTEIVEADPSQKARIMEAIKQHGGERLSLVPEKNLPELFASINRIRKEIV